MRHIFISYSSKDRPHVDELAADLDLLVDDVRVWYDRELNRSGGHQWWSLILEQIRRCDVFIYALSPHVLRSEPCRREHAYARALGKPVLPVILEDVEIRYLPVELQAAQLVKYQQRSREQQRSLKESLRNLPPAPPLPAPLPTPPEVPLDPVGVLFDRIARLTSDPDQQRLAIVEIEDLHDEEAYRKHVPELLARLLERDDVLTVRNLKRAQELLTRIGTSGSTFDPIIAPSAPPADPVQTAIARARSFTSKRNRDWQPFVTAFADLKITDMPFCLVPVGSFRMGGDDDKYYTEKPSHPQTIEQPYWLGQFPVTNAQWAQAVKAGAVQEPLDVGNSLKWYHDPQMADAPVVGLTWFMARDFTAWLGGRLPTEREWEYAARGVESLCYPWGDDWNPDLPIWDKNSGGQPALVTTKPEGKSWVNARHLSGNVWEWTGSLYDEYPYPADGSREQDKGNRTDVLRVMRAGSWHYNDSFGLRAAFRYDFNPDLRDDTLGFRCARSL